jgi:D-aspartate ligase
MAQEAATRPVHGSARSGGARPAVPKGLNGTPPAIVIGDVDMVSALAVGGIPTVLFDDADSDARFSRHVRGVLPFTDPAREPDETVRTLLGFAREQPQPPVLLPQSDDGLLLVSRRRADLAPSLRFAVGDPELVEQLVDKGRFQALAEARGLPIPRARRLRPVPGDPPPALDLRFPLVLKPIQRRADWDTLTAGRKALQADDQAALAALWPQLIDASSDIIAQELVAGPESRIESFHAYIDERGEEAGSFTGRKLRTFPVHHGHSTAVEITDQGDVAALGREILQELGFRGVAKVDFKRDADGVLHLLEINGRVTLWALPGALAGVNLPALVYADLTGRARPATGRARPGVAWCRPLRDVRAARATGMATLEWLRWARRCDAVSGLSRADPLPFLRGVLPATVAHQASHAAGVALRRAAQRLR